MPFCVLGDQPVSLATGSAKALAVSGTVLGTVGILHLHI